MPQGTGQLFRFIACPLLETSLVMAQARPDRFQTKESNNEHYNDRKDVHTTTYEFWNIRGGNMGEEREQREREREEREERERGES